ncbi:MAG TPA: hypothetical protein VIM73_01110, partial [Polyangiaceae bacterium]
MRRLLRTMSDLGSGAIRVGSHAVSVVLTNGETVAGSLEAFSPDAKELTIDTGGRTRQRIVTSQIAYVGFH